jgi:hypothetical protein
MDSTRKVTAQEAGVAAHEKIERAPVALPRGSYQGAIRVTVKDLRTAKSSKQAQCALIFLAGPSACSVLHHFTTNRLYPMSLTI